MSVLYVDSSAALKRIFREAETEFVGSTLRSRVGAGDLVAASTLTWVEVTRSVLRAGRLDAEAQAHAAMSGIAELPLDETVLTRARWIGAPELRSLDAIHLAAAVVLGATEVLTFDARLAAAARSVGVKAIP